MEDKILNIESQLENIIKTLAAQKTADDNNATIIDNNFQILNSKIDSLKKSLNALHSDTQQNFDDVKLELVKIQKITGYEDMYSNLSIVGKK